MAYKRPHGSFKLKTLKMPQDAFWLPEQIPVEAKLRIGVRLHKLERYRKKFQIEIISGKSKA